MSHSCWSYHDDDGPDHWGSLHPDWRACTEGAEQSPVTLPTQASEEFRQFATVYRPVAARRSRRKHAVQVDVGPGSHLVLNRRAFRLRQFHFHTPCEHRWPGRELSGELHLVHSSEEGGIAVLGVALACEAKQALPERLWAQLRTAAPGVEFDIQPAALLPASSRYLSYRGSLTMPPCTEGVHWILAREPMGVAEEHRAWLEQEAGCNARPLQPLGARVVRGIRRDSL